MIEKKVTNVENCEMLCLDEADKLLSQDFKCMLDRLTSHLPETELEKIAKNYVGGNGVDMSKFPDFKWEEPVSDICVKISSYLSLLKDREGQIVATNVMKASP